jgi:hypothetical protein
MLDRAPREPQEVRLVADVQIRVLEEDLPLPPLAEVAVLRRVTPTHHHRRRTPLGEPRTFSASARVSPLVALGQR